jgi:transposase InsO family protein
MSAPLPQGETQRDGNADPLSVERMCALAGVARAGYYRWLQGAAPRLEEAGVRDAIQRIALRQRHYGYRRIARELRRDGWCVNHKRVLRLMREDNLLCLRAKPFVPATTDSHHGWHVVANLARGMLPSGVDQLWVADITYIRLAHEFIYLAVVMDAFSRKVIGWAIEAHLQASLALAALNMAILARQPGPHRLIHHSDRGVQYACGDYVGVLEAHAISASMSRPGNPYDNAKAESFMKTLKQEEVNGQAYRDIAQARAEIGSFIEAVYNTTRLHSALGYRPPVEFEDDANRQNPLIRPIQAVSSSPGPLSPILAVSP